MLGRIDFAAPLEAGGTDAILAGAAIWAEADATFAADNNSTELVFATNTSAAATERMRIDSSGRVGIAKAAPDTLLHLYESTSTGTEAQIKIEQGSTGDSAIFFKAGADWSIGTDNSASDAFVISASSNLNAAPKVSILTGGGITFNGDTAAANALDYYEEGTWTPVVKYDGLSGTSYSTGSANVATYTKVGRVVYVAADVEITNPSADNDTSTVILTGLPFTSANIAQWWRMTTSLNLWTKTNGAGVIGAVGANGTYVAMY